MHSNCDLISFLAANWYLSVPYALKRYTTRRRCYPQSLTRFVIVSIADSASWDMVFLSTLRGGGAEGLSDVGDRETGRDLCSCEDEMFLCCDSTDSSIIWMLVEDGENKGPGSSEEGKKVDEQKLQQMPLLMKTRGGNILLKHRWSTKTGSKKTVTIKGY